MKLLTAAALCLLLGACTNEIGTPGPDKNGVEQEHIRDDTKYLCGSRDCISTYVWYGGEIVFTTYIKINSDSAIIKHHLDSAKTILKNLERLK